MKARSNGGKDMRGLNLRVVPTQDGKHIAVITHGAGKEEARVQLDEAGAQRLIRGVAERRTALFPANTAKSGDEPLQIAHDPKWEIDSVAPDGAVMVNLRHPGMGWLQFRFPQEKAAKLSNDLIHPAGS